VYGPVRTVVWQGSVGDRRPYADLVGNTDDEKLSRPVLRGLAPSNGASYSVKHDTII
jgi:hypothetical protein